jgi:PAS domain S-box-containing protein
MLDAGVVDELDGGRRLSPGEESPLEVEHPPSALAPAADPVACAACDRHRLLLEHLSQVVFQTDARGAWTFLNPAWTEMTGFSVEESLGRDFLEFVHPDDRARHAGLLEPVAAPDHDYIGREVRYVTKIGSVRWVEVRAQLLTRGAAVLGTAGTLTDVTDRKHAEDALLATRARLSHLLLSSPAIIYSRDARAGFPFTFVSDNVRQLGLDAQELLDEPGAWGARVHPEDAVEVGEFLRDVGQDRQSREYRLGDPDGTIRWIHDERTIIRDAAGRAIEIVGSWLDVTARRRAEEASAHLEQEFRHAQRLDAVGRLAGGVAHDFNNLLTVITGRCQLLFRRLAAEPGLERDVDIVMATARRASTLTNQLLAFSRKQVLEPTLLDLNEVVTNMERLLERLIAEDIVLGTSLDPTLGRVRADRGQIEQVLMNLVVNARDAMPRGGRLTIETANAEVDADFARRHVGFTPGAYVVIAVRDSGVGIPPEIRSKLFEPFFTTKPEGQGTGLGLSTVYGIVKQSGGEVIVDSEPGQGATFRIYLPRVEAVAPEVRSSEEQTEVPRGVETILLAEDATIVRDLMADLLKSCGYQVLAPPSARQALDLLQNHPGAIDLLVTDVVMPDLNGRELSEHARRLRPSVRVLYVSGYPDDEVIRHGLPSQDAMFLAKPFTAQALARRVRQALDRRGG